MPPKRVSIAPFRSRSMSSIESAPDQAQDFQLRVDTALATGPNVLRDKARQPGALGQGHHRHQVGVRHEIRVVERCVRLREGMLTRPETPYLTGGSRLRDKRDT
jgi:hypothetical protein